MARARAHHVPKKPRPSSTARGYGSEHRKLRAWWVRRFEAGEVIACARCGEVIDRDEPWDLGHNDVDRRFYNGPEHSRCNRATSAHLAEWQRQLDAGEF